MAVWVTIGLFAHLMGWADRGLGQTVLGLCTQLLWFLGVYLGIAGLAPLMFRLHRRIGASAVVGLVAVAVVVDVVRLTVPGLSALGVVNFAAVWLAIHQLGFCWRDGQLHRAHALWLAGLSAACLVGLVTYGPYPVSMVGMPGDSMSNMTPPSLALLSQGFMLVGLVVWLRPYGERLLARPAVWRVVMLGGRVAMTVYLWHLSALFLLISLMRWLEVELPTVGSLAWWISRPVWIVSLVVLTAGLVAVFVRFDSGVRPAPCPCARWRDAITAVSLVALVAGVFGIAVTGVDLLRNHSTPLLGLPITPVVAVGVLGVGAVGLAVAGRGHIRMNGRSH